MSAIRPSAQSRSRAARFGWLISLVAILLCFVRVFSSTPAQAGVLLTHQEAADISVVESAAAGEDADFAATDLDGDDDPSNHDSDDDSDDGVEEALLSAESPDVQPPGAALLSFLVSGSAADLHGQRVPRPAERI